MERIHLVAMKRDRKKLLEFLQRRGTVEVSSPAGEDEVFKITDTSATRALLQKYAATATTAVELLDKHAGTKGESLAFLRGRKAVKVCDNDDFCLRRDDVLRDAQRVVQLDREMAEAKGEIARCEGQIEALTSWLSLPVPLSFAGTRRTSFFVGSLEGEWTVADILTRLAEADPNLGAVHVELVSATKQQTCIYALGLKEQGPALGDALRAIGLAKPSSQSAKDPARKKEQLEGRIKDHEQAIADAKTCIEGFADKRDDFLFLEDHMKMRAEKYEVIERLQQSSHVFILTGYVPAKRAPAVTKALEERFDCAVETTPVEQGGDTPVALKNPWFTEPLEGVLESYSLPGKGELDPTSVMAIFYYVMFGLMFSDAGYGAIMFFTCLVVLLRFRNMEPNWSRNVRLFLWCGLSTMFWGVMFSSYFGDAPTVIAKTFFNVDFAIPAVMPALNDPMNLLVFSVSLGLIHLTAGYVMKGVTCAKNGAYADILYDAVLPVTTIYPLIAILTTTDIFEGLAGFKFTLSPMVQNVCWAITGVSILGIVLTGGRESKSWAKRLMKGAFAVYNTLSGWLSDALSYSRLLALGLATGVIAGVFNSLGSMAGGGFVGIILFVAVFAVGQALNFGINVLGAYVHSNRLEYVEFFGKFYDGGGRRFEPFGIHTKHYKIIEEEAQHV